MLPSAQRAKDTIRSLSCCTGAGDPPRAKSRRTGRGGQGDQSLACGAALRPPAVGRQQGSDRLTEAVGAGRNQGGEEAQLKAWPGALIAARVRLAGTQQQQQQQPQRAVARPNFAGSAARCPKCGASPAAQPSAGRCPSRGGLRAMPCAPRRRGRGRSVLAPLLRRPVSPKEAGACRSELSSSSLPPSLLRGSWAGEVPSPPCLIDPIALPHFNLTHEV